MQDRWSDDAARGAEQRWASAGAALALRTYTSRLIGADPGLVLHGGGNTSVKVDGVDLLGRPVRWLCVKGSGWDLATIAPQGHPAVDLDALAALRARDTLTDEEMVNAIRTHQRDADAPTPSIETLLHAFLPHRYIDHSHADAILAVGNRVGGADALAAALGPDIPVVPYVKAGFDLAKLAADVHDAHPGAIGLALAHHGLFTWGDTAEESYRRHIAVVERAEAWLAQRPPAPRDPGPPTDDAAAAVAPWIRRALGRQIVVFRGEPHHRAWARSPDLADLALAGPLTPDHVIRTRPRPAVVRHTGDWASAVDAAFAAYRADADAYFERHAGARSLRRIPSLPTVIWVEQVGLFAAGDTVAAAAAAADLATATHGAKVVGAPHGAYLPLADADLFEMEYWSLEQAKLGRSKPAPLTGRVGWITGGAGAIGVGIAAALLEAGACVVLVDRDADALQRAATALAGGARLRTVRADITDAAAVDHAWDEANRAFGGVDLVVANAGIAVTGRLADLSEDDFRDATAVNLHGTFLTLRAAARRLPPQGVGGDVIVISTKNVFEPGAGFGAYSATKAGAHQLARIAALELAEAGVRVNLVTPDAVFSEGEFQSGLWAKVGPERARARGVSTEALPALYQQKNLLRAQITGRHVGAAVVFFASGATPTTGAVLPVDGGLPGAFPR